jgi:hypothetical protein
MKPDAWVGIVYDAITAPDMMHDHGMHDHGTHGDHGSEKHEP